MDEKIVPCRVFFQQIENKRPFMLQHRDVPSLAIL